MSLKGLESLWIKSISEIINCADILSIKLLGKVVILTGLDGDLNHYEMSYSLPEVQLSIYIQVLQIHNSYIKGFTIIHKICTLSI